MKKRAVIFFEVLYTRLLFIFGRKKDNKAIPKGVYCYEIIGEVKSDGSFSCKPCKYYRKSGETTACTYVGFMGWDPCLSDQCKICNVE